MNTTTSSNGTTRIERLVDKIQARKEQRMAVTRSERHMFLRMCTECSERKTVCGKPNIISFDDLIELKDEVYLKLKQNPHHRKLKNVFKIFNLAVESCKEVNDGLFYFTEFEEYYLVRDTTYTIVLSIPFFRTSFSTHLLFAFPVFASYLKKNRKRRNHF